MKAKEYQLEINKSNKETRISLFEKNINTPLFILYYSQNSKNSKFPSFMFDKTVKISKKYVNHEVIIGEINKVYKNSHCIIEKVTRNKKKIIRTIKNVKLVKVKILESIKTISEQIENKKFKKVGNSKVYQFRSNNLLKLFNNLFMHLHRIR